MWSKKIQTTAKLTVGEILKKKNLKKWVGGGRGGSKRKDQCHGWKGG